MKDYLFNLLYEGSAGISPFMAVQSMTIALALSIFVALTYKLTYSGVAYSKKFNTSLIMMSLITTMVMNILGSSLALSLGMVGALSIVRFRTAVKDSKDTTFIFWAIAIGLGAGSNNYYIVVVGTIFVAVVTVILSFGFKDKETYLVIVRSDLTALEEVRAKLFSTYKASKLRSETITSDYAEIVYQIKFNKDYDINEYEKIKAIDGVHFINLVSQNGETLGWEKPEFTLKKENSRY